MGETNMLQNVQNKHAAKTENTNASAAFKVGGFFNARSLQHMGLFDRKKTAKELPPLFSESEIDGATYDQVMEFLVSVNDDDFSKIVKIAELYRNNHVEVAKITGIEQTAQPSIFDQQTAPAAAEDTAAGSFLDEDDDITAAFLDDDEKPGTNAKSGKPIKVTDETDQLQS